METATDGTDLRLNFERRKEQRIAGIADSWSEPVEGEGASDLACSESQQVSARPAEVDEDLWRALMTSEREKWARRASDDSRTPEQREYAKRRKRRLEGSYAHPAFECGKTGFRVRCGCGTEARWYSCRQHLVCEQCGRARGRKQNARIRNGLESATMDEHERKRRRPWSARRSPIFVTISLEHSGDIRQDRKDLMTGWTLFRKRVGRLIGESFVFVGVQEITPGDDGLGHPHAHMVCYWPWLDWGELHEMWRECCPRSKQINFVKAYSARGGARYMSKYVSKGSNTRDFTPEQRARVVAGTYATRWCFTSVGFWIPFVPRCQCCGQPKRRVTVEPWTDDACHSRRSRGDPGSAEGPCEKVPEADERGSARCGTGTFPAY